MFFCVSFYDCLLKMINTNAKMSMVLLPNNSSRAPRKDRAVVP